jgi:hypothetical protein
MKILKIILIVIGTLVALPFALALFIKKEYAVQREIVIDKSSGEVFEYIKYLKNQDSFSKWALQDPAMRKDFRGTDGSVGFVYAWDGPQAGKGEQEIKSITEGEGIQTELRFIKPFEGKGYARLVTAPVSAAQTKVTWSMEGRSSYPMNFMNLFMGSLLGNDLQESLRNLKTVLETE